MNAITLGAALLFSLMILQIAAVVVIWARQAMPQMPFYFRAMLSPAILLSALTSGAVAWLALTPSEHLIGADALILLVVFFALQVFIWLILDLYTVFHYLRSRRRR